MLACNDVLPSGRALRCYAKWANNILISTKEKFTMPGCQSNCEGCDQNGYCPIQTTQGMLRRRGFDADAEAVGVGGDLASSLGALLESIFGDEGPTPETHNHPYMMPGGHHSAFSFPGMPVFRQMMTGSMSRPFSGPLPFMSNGSSHELTIGPDGQITGRHHAVTWVQVPTDFLDENVVRQAELVSNMNGTLRSKQDRIKVLHKEVKSKDGKRKRQAVRFKHAIWSEFPEHRRTDGLCIVRDGDSWRLTSFGGDHLCNLTEEQATVLGQMKNEIEALDAALTVARAELEALSQE
ncbi:MAG: hypothetical protein WCX69_02460, partial [Candidatus Paceibacterota bacterium]